MSILYKKAGAMAALQRRYSQRVLKVLFATSGNQCAYPGCKNFVIEPGTPFSESLVVAQVCHIIGASPDGPRGKSRMTGRERNDGENLLLLCPTHHRIVDGQWESYDTKTLLKWKSDHEARVRNRITAQDTSANGKLNQHSSLSTEINIIKGDIGSNASVVQIYKTEKQ